MEKDSRVSPTSGFAPPVETRWKPGTSGNPGGVPKKVLQIRKLAAAKCPRAIERLGEWMESGEYKASISACVAMLDRGLGKTGAMRELYPAKPQDESAEQLAVNQLTEEQQARIYAIIREGAV